MPLRIVFDYAGRQTRSDIARVVARLVGGLLAFIGLAATVVAIPAGFVVIADIITLWHGEHDQVFSPDFPLRQVEAAFIAATLIAILGIRYGRRLVRGHRSIVLFLRRFGYHGSMQVVTFAVANTIGAAWRLVTLDDDEIAAVGVDSASKTMFQVGGGLARLASATQKGVLAGMQWTSGGMWAVAAIQAALVARDWKHFNPKVLDPYVAVLVSVMERKVPIHYFGFSLPGAFAILATGLALCFVALMVVFVALLAMFPLFGFVMFATSSAEALRKAEAAQRETIRHAGDIDRVTGELANLARQTFAPRLMVLRVATSVWQETVSALADVASATIIDISEPTENVAWELEELQRLGGHERCIFIGDRARIGQWPSAQEGLGSGSLEERVATLIGARPVLAYTADRKGMRRFARALHGMLLDAQPAPPKRSG